MASGSRRYPGISGSNQCPIIGFIRKISAPLFVSVRGIILYLWCQWEECCPFIGVSVRKSVPLLVKVG